jgi:hypothetical protein
VVLPRQNSAGVIDPRSKDFDSDFATRRRNPVQNKTPHEESDPRHHTQRLKQMLKDTAAHAREDVAKTSDPKAQALFETSAEVLLGLAKAFEDFEKKSETAWRAAGSR